MSTYYDIPKSSYDVRDFTITAAADLPEEFCLSTVPVKNQGSKPTCTAHALSSACEVHHQRQHGYYEEFSTEFIYGFREKGEYVGDGMSIRQGLQVLLKFGNTFERDCSGNHDYKEAMEKVEKKLEKLKELAYPHRISAYFRINAVDEIKTALMKYGVVIVSMRVYEGDKLVDDVYTVNANKSLGSHCVFIYGWNKKGWLVQNSWGESYGGDGRFIIPFDFSFKEKWGVVDEITEGEFNKPKRSKISDVFYFLWNCLINFILRFANRS